MNSDIPPIHEQRLNAISAMMNATHCAFPTLDEFMGATGNEIWVSLKVLPEYNDFILAARLQGETPSSRNAIHYLALTRFKTYYGSQDPVADLLEKGNGISQYNKTFVQNPVVDNDFGNARCVNFLEKRL